LNTTKSNKKYQAIFGTAKDLFWKYGIKRVSIEEICKEAKVSKMTFYKFFPNKIELAKTILSDVIDESMEKWEKLVKSNIPIKEKIEELFTIKFEAANNISMEFINDIYKNPEMGLMPIIEIQGQKSMNLFIEFLKDSQSKGLIRKDIKIEFILYYVNNASKMMDDKQLLCHYEQPQDLIMEMMNFMFYGLSPKE
jgi:AcrR family transcriptional regulator